MLYVNAVVHYVNRCRTIVNYDTFHCEAGILNPYGNHYAWVSSIQFIVMSLYFLNRFLVYNHAVGALYIVVLALCLRTIFLNSKY